MVFRFRILMVVAACAVLGSVASAADHGLVVELNADKTALTTSEDVNVRFTLTNTGSQVHRVYAWQVPIGEIEHDLFEVVHNGKPVAYLGIDAKRGPATSADLIRLGPGQSVSATVELTALYDMSKPGSYSVRYRSGLGALLRTTDVDLVGRGIDSNAVGFELTGTARPSGLEAFAQAGGETDVVTPLYTRCTASQIQQVGTALASADAYANNAVSYLAAGTKGPRYTTWFGTYDATRYNTVKSHFTAINDTFDNRQMTFDCGCKKPYYAYVYPSQPYKVYFCKAFWSAPNTGTDSRAGTIIHETSHFTAVSSTDDWVYGQTGCKSLAISNPTNAIDNADSHEYFGENTPVQN